MYAAGNSLQEIAKQLNAEGVVSPQPQKGRISRSWCPTSIRTILRNERYRGRVIWGKTVKVRSRSGKRIYKRTAPVKWVVRELPEQRIVSEELWTSVRTRIDTLKQVYGEIGRKGGMQGRSVSSPYLFSGLLKCSEGGANISIRFGRWRGRSDVCMAVLRIPSVARAFARTAFECFGVHWNAGCWTGYKNRSCDRKQWITFSKDLSRTREGARQFERGVGANAPTVKRHWRAKSRTSPM